MRAMDRFEWLECQSWLLPTSYPAATASVEWLFDGFASFYTCPLPHQHDNVLSQNTAHLFFSLHSSSSTLDPAQLALKIGMTMKGSLSISRDMLFSFENSGTCYCLDFKQVLSVIRWRQEQGCHICKEYVCNSATSEMENNCSCQLLPSYVTLRLKHVSMIIYSRNESSRQIVGIMDMLWKVFQEENPSDCCGSEPVSASDNVPTCLGTVLGSSKTTLQRFLTKLDCMVECAVSAVDVCNADSPRMAWMLHVLMQHSAEHREFKMQSKSLKIQLQSFLKALEDEKDAHFSNLWTTSQQDAKAGTIVALQNTLEQRKKVEEALLWLELINAQSLF